MDKYTHVLAKLFIVVMVVSFTKLSVASTQPSIEILDKSALKLISIDSKLEVLADGFAWTEGPLWVDSDNGYLLFSDIPNNRVHKYSKQSGVTTYLEPSGATQIQAYDSKQGSNGLLLDSQKRLVLLQQGDRRVAYMDAPLHAPEPKFITMVDAFMGKRLNSPNDAAYHENGDLYFTDPPYGLNLGENSPHRALSYMGIFALSPNGDMKLIDDTIDFPNGIGFSPDYKSLYIGASDSKKPAWYQFDLDEQGNATNKRTLFDATDFKQKTNAPGYPDGMAVHSNGTIFATGPNGVWVFSKGHKLIARINTNKATANCTLSSDESKLFITAHDTLFAVTLGKSN